MNPDGALLLYDGTCGFCARSVQFVLRHEGARGTLRFAPLDGETGRAIRAAHPELAGVDSLIWVDAPAVGASARVLVRSTAVLEVARYLGGIWRVLGALGRVVPRVVRDATYDVVARHRQQISGRADACLLPSPDQRVRFID
jgi:predicted DCC family thiol-disulfide oxidoreductase YuxK